MFQVVSEFAVAKRFTRRALRRADPSILQYLESVLQTLLLASTLDFEMMSLINHDCINDFGHLLEIMNLLLGTQVSVLED